MQQKKSLGFTIIELLVVIAIIGILAAIAIQSYSTYKKQGFDASAKNDLRNAAAAEEAYFVENAAYLSCATSAACTTRFGTLGGLSPGVTLQISGTTSGFTATTSHPSGSGTVFTWDSSQGGLQ